MHKAKRTRRWLQYRLRSLLLVTLGVAAWLGYETRQARTVRQQCAAIREVGGEVELATTTWSVLRFIDPATYGRQIVRVQIRGSHVDRVIALLQAMPGLREVRVAYDGSSDVSASWHRLHSTLRGAKIVPAADSYDFLYDAFRGRKDRFAAKLSQSGAPPRLVERVEFRGGSDEYFAFRVPDGSVGELLMFCELYSSGNGVLVQTSVLLVADRYVDSKRTNGTCFGVKVSINDIDGDGCPELALEVDPQCKDEIDQTLPGDPRIWRGLYAIERSGFRNLLPHDRFNKASDEEFEKWFLDAFGRSP